MVPERKRPVVPEPGQDQGIRITDAADLPQLPTFSVGSPQQERCAELREWIMGRQAQPDAGPAQPDAEHAQQHLPLQQAT